MVPATTSDAFLLGLESLMRRTGQGHHLSTTVIELDGPPDDMALRQAADALGRRHPLLHARIRRSPLTFIAAWHPDPAAPVPVHHHRGGDLDGLLSKLVCRRSIDIQRSGPNLEIHTLPLPENRHALILLWPHSLFDGIGIDKLIAEMDSFETEPTDAWGETNKASGSASELWKSAHPMIEEMRTFPETRIRSLHQKGKAAGDSRFEILRFDRGTTVSIRRHMAETAGELLLVPYYAALSARAVARVIAHRHPEEESAILLTLPVQRTPNPAKRPVFHNHMVAWSLLLKHDDLQELAPATKALYRAYSSFMRRKLPAAMDALTKLNERCPSGFYLLPIKHYMKGEICSLFHSHTGELAAGTDELFGQGIHNAYHAPSVSTPPGIGIFFSEKGGRLTCTISWREGSLDDDEHAILRQALLDDLGLPSFKR